MHFTQTSLLLSLPVLALSNVLPVGPPDANLEANLFDDGKSVIVQMFQWSWDSIATECTNFLGPHGYDASPPMEHVAAEGWFNDYSVVSYNMTSRHGSRNQFQNMINTCHNAGLKVYTDVLMNHMTDQSSGGIGFAGTVYSHYDHPGIYQSTDFHHCSLEAGDEIVYFTDNSTRVEIQNCELFNHADLKTETEYVRARLAAYLNDLLSLGLDGFRLDAARHIPQDDLSNILSRMTSNPYLTQQTIFGSPVQPEEYLPNGDVQEFRYTTALKDGFLGKGISDFTNLDNKGWAPGTQANVFVADHDTERNNHSLSYHSPNNAYFLATYFLLAHPYGKPTVTSGYEFSFSNTGAGSPNGGVGTCNGTAGANGWLCEHRYTAITGMVGFRNNVGNSALTDWVAPSSQQIAFGRGTSGFIAINNVDEVWSTTFTTSLPDGVYCNVIDGMKSSDGSCTGSIYTVAQGQFYAMIQPRDALAIHVGVVAQ